MTTRVGQFVLYISLLLATVVVGQNSDTTNKDQCASDNAISLPREQKCLVADKTALLWSTAAARCENQGGQLFNTPDALLSSRPLLMRCLTALGNQLPEDMWINSFGVWSPHFMWTNKSSLHEVDYCTQTEPTRENNEKVTSDKLSVDFCVYTCLNKASQYTVFHISPNKSIVMECYCLHRLPEFVQYQRCPSQTVNASAVGWYYVLQTKEDSKINVLSVDVRSRTLSICATVNARTINDKEISSEMCNSGQQFFCELEDVTKCSKMFYSETSFRIIRGKCVVRVELNYNWWAARAHCKKLGGDKAGDLWNVYKLSDLAQVTMADVRTVPKYWIGATNYNWTFDANSISLKNFVSNDYNWVRCGHMTTVANQDGSTSWEWSGTDCQQKKAFICEYTKVTFANLEESQREVICPVPLLPIPSLTPKPFNQTAPISGTLYDDGGFPIAAVIAAVIAAIILITCLALTFAFCIRRNWMAAGRRKSREQLTVVPYLADVSAVDYDSHANMSSFSDQGSQIGLVKGGYQNNHSGYGMSTSYGEHSGAFSNKSLDRKQKETLDRKLTESKNYLASGNTSMDERGFSATYSTLPNRPRDTMTLQAQMDIKDEVELAAMRASLRNKPEMSLVTDNVDMNFTVNHAVSRLHSNPESDLSKLSLERTMEEITLPVSEGGMGLNLPERVAEESRLHSTMTRNYHGM